ncbi:MAG: hypothetical protein V1926_02170 [Candidatus Peregrinibacteria bacterium]
MSKRPTPKKRREKSRGRTQYAMYVDREVKRLTDYQASPYAPPAPSKGKADKALKGITRIKA